MSHIARQQNPDDKLMRHVNNEGGYQYPVNCLCGAQTWATYNQRHKTGSKCPMRLNAGGKVVIRTCPVENCKGKIEARKGHPGRQCTRCKRNYSS